MVNIKHVVCDNNTTVLNVGLRAVMLYKLVRLMLMITHETTFSYIPVLYNYTKTYISNMFLSIIGSFETETCIYETFLDNCGCPTIFSELCFEILLD